jgi:3-oxoacyl-[acyl-carrier protein] reductase
MKLSNRVALVTGAGRGIGRAIAAKLAAEGAAVVANDLDVDAVAETVAGIKAAGGTAEAAAGDVTADGFAEQLVDQAVNGCGGLHIIVNNAGYIWNGAIHNHGDDQWDAMLDIHAKAPFRILRAAGRYFRGQVPEERAQGIDICRKVVNISSVSGVFGAATQVSYAAGKMAVVGITNSLAQEWGRWNITVNAVAFGPIETRLIQEYDETPAQVDISGRQHRVGLSVEQRRAVAAAIPLGRFGTPDDGAGAVYLLCLPESDFISGQTLICAGGGHL